MDTELTSHAKPTISWLCLKSERRKMFLIVHKTKIYTYQTVCSHSRSLSILLNLLFFEWVEKTDLAQSMFKNTCYRVT